MMKRRPDRNGRRGSMLVALLLAATLVLHAGVEALPLWSRQVESMRLAERRDRLERLRRGLARHRARHGAYPTDLQALTARDGAGPFLPRILGDPCREDGAWTLLRDETGRIHDVEFRPASPRLVRPPLKEIRRRG